MATLAQRRMRSKLPVLQQARTGTVRDHHRRLLPLQLGHIAFLDAQIEALTSAMAECLRALSQAAVAEPTRSAPALADVPASP
jgi:hypothetical protein